MSEETKDMKKCLQCYKTYKLNTDLTKEERNRSKFCCRKCHWQHVRENKELYPKPPSREGCVSWNKGRGKDAACVTCGKVFYVPNHRLESTKYCSIKCKAKSQKGTIRSIEVRNKISKKLKGKNSHLWRGGVSLKNKDFKNKFMLTPGYKYWRDTVYRRDNHKCQICGDNKGGNLHANHIKKFIDYPELRLNQLNGITLCDYCHISIVTNHEPEWESYFLFNLETRRFIESDFIPKKIGEDICH